MSLHLVDFCHFAYYLCRVLQVRLVVKHVANEELEAIPAAAEDLFIIGGKDALEKRLQVSVATAEVVLRCLSLPSFSCTLVFTTAPMSFPH